MTENATSEVTVD